MTKVTFDSFVGRPGKREVCVGVCGRPVQGLVCKAIRPFVSHAALPEVPCTAAVYGLQQASTVLNSSDDIWTRAQFVVSFVA